MSLVFRVSVLLSFGLLPACTTKPVIEEFTITSFDRFGQVESRVVVSYSGDAEVIDQLKPSAATWLTGTGTSNSASRGVARNSAIALALEDLVKKIEAQWFVLTITDYTIKDEAYDADTGEYKITIGAQIPHDY